MFVKLMLKNIYIFVNVYMCGGVHVCVEVCMHVWMCARVCGGVHACVNACTG